METIRQSCPQCGSTLELPSSAVGRLARCPACQHTFRVPSPMTSASDAVAAQPASPEKTGVGVAAGADHFSEIDQASNQGAHYTSNPYSASSPPAGSSYSNPYAFSPALASTESLQVEKSRIEIRTASIDQIVSASISIFSARWQPLVLSGLVYFVASFVIAGANFFVGVAMAAAAQGGGQNVGLLVQFGAAVLTNLLTWYFALGLMNVGLMAARGLETGPTKMFVSLNLFGRLFVLLVVLAIIASSPNLLPLFLEAANDEMVAALSTLIGFSFVGLITGILLWTIWPIFYLILDERSAEGAGFSLAFRIGSNNLLNGFLMALIAVVLGIAAAFTCSLGSIVTQPLLMLVAAVGYLLMTSQPVSDPSRLPYQIPNYDAR